MTDIVKLALDAHRGKIAGNFSKDDSMEVLRQELIAANNGETSLNYKSIRDGKCNGLFAIIETIIDKAIIEGIQDDNFFVQMVDYRNLAMGDQADFYAPDNTYFAVSEISEGNRGIRRQRAIGGEQLRITPTVKAIRIYEEMNRLLAGRVDMNQFIDRVAHSFKAQMYDEICELWNGVADSTLPAFRMTGTFSPTALLKVIQNVEAASGKDAVVVGTKVALSVLAGELTSDGQKDEIYNTGYLGKFFGTPVVSTRNSFKAGTDFSQTVMNDKQLFVLSSDNKPVKHVTEGDSTIILGSPTDNADLTQEYICMTKTGSGVLVSEHIGSYIFD